MIVSKRDLDELRDVDDDTCVSIYINTSSTSNGKAEKIRWKQACNKIFKKLELLNTPDRVINKLMKPAINLLNNKELWSNLSESLCMFISFDFSKYLVLSSKSANLEFLDEHFILSPLLKYYKKQGRFYLIDLTPNAVHLYECNNYKIIRLRSIQKSSINIGQIEPDKKWFTQVIENLISDDLGYSKYNSTPLLITANESSLESLSSHMDYKPIFLVTKEDTINDESNSDLHNRVKDWIMHFNSLLADRNMEVYKQRRPEGLALTSNDDISLAIAQGNLKELYVIETFIKNGTEAIRKIDDIIMASDSIGAKVHFINGNQQPGDDMITYGVARNHTG